MNISNFMTWFITQFINIGTNLIGQLDNLKLTNNISLLDFTITIAIISAFIGIIITAPSLHTIGKEMTRKEEKKK